MARELPILFSTEMVKAILDGRKTATRRLIKTPYFVSGDEEDPMSLQVLRTAPKGSKLYRQIGEMPYPDDPYKIGSNMYVRETWKCWRAHRYEATADIMYKAGGEDIRIFFPNGSTDSANRYDYDQFVYKWFGEKWRPSIHMPKEAARIWLKVTDVRAERLQDIDDSGIMADGLEIGCDFENIWNNTVKKPDMPRYGWDANPWVWVIEFKRCEKPGKGEKQGG